MTEFVVEGSYRPTGGTKGSILKFQVKPLRLYTGGAVTTSNLLDTLEHSSFDKYKNRTSCSNSYSNYVDLARHSLLYILWKSKKRKQKLEMLLGNASKLLNVRDS